MTIQTPIGAAPSSIQAFTDDFIAARNAVIKFQNNLEMPVSIANVSIIPNAPDIPAEVYRVDLLSRKDCQCCWELVVCIDNKEVDYYEYEGFDLNELPEDHVWPEDGTPGNLNIKTHLIGVQKWIRKYHSSGTDTGWENLTEEDNDE